MNPDNNNPNQPTGQVPQQLPSPPQPWQQPPSPPTTAPSAPFTPPGGRSKRLMVVIAALVAIIVLGIGSWFLLSGSSDNGDGTAITTTVPAGWKSFDTELGFTVDVPAGWSSLASFEGKVNNLASEYVNLGQPIDPDTESPATGNQPTITASTIMRTDTSDKQSFISAVTDKKAIAKNFGLSNKTEQIKLSHSTINVNGKEWLRIDLDVNDNSTTILYYWVNDHAIGLSMVNSGDSQKDTSSYKGFLLPMAASAEVTE